jgi:hypothetical protein
MKQDMDLVRQILLQVEATDEEAHRHKPLAIEGFDRATVAHRVEIMQGSWPGRGSRHAGRRRAPVRRLSVPPHLTRPRLPGSHSEGHGLDED